MSKKQRQANKRGEQLTSEEWSAEQLEHKRENDGREKRADRESQDGRTEYSVDLM